MVSLWHLAALDSNAPLRADLFDLQDPSDLEACAEMIFVERSALFS